jgi:hypothetical protein
MAFVGAADGRCWFARCLAENARLFAGRRRDFSRRQRKIDTRRKAVRIGKFKPPVVPSPFTEGRS